MFWRSRDVTATYGMALFGLAIAFVGVLALWPSLRLPATAVFLGSLLAGGWLIASRKPEKYGFKSLFGVAFSAIGEGVIATDRDGTVRILNRAAEHLTGWTQAEIAGKNFGEIFHDCPTGVGEWNAEQLITHVVDENREVGSPSCSCLRTKNDELISVRQSAAPIRDKAGRVVGVVLVFEDVRKRRAAEQRLNTEQSVT
ncbi:MAG: PAS domain S-box protein, partial [Verrucomicrobiota bacterium]|nr:PAS domain S-box protein [Verrucomicrobiota bacterium]